MRIKTPEHWLYARLLAISLAKDPPDRVSLPHLDDPRIPRIKASFWPHDSIAIAVAHYGAAPDEGRTREVLTAICNDPRYIEQKLATETREYVTNIMRQCDGKTFIRYRVNLYAARSALLLHAAHKAGWLDYVKPDDTAFTAAIREVAMDRRFLFLAPNSIAATSSLSTRTRVDAAIQMVERACRSGKRL